MSVFLGMKIQILLHLVVVAFFIFSTQIYASDGDKSKQFEEPGEHQLRRRDLIIHPSMETSEDEALILRGLAENFFCQQCIHISSKARQILASDSTLAADVNILSSEVCTFAFSDMRRECLQMTKSTFIEQAIPFLRIIFSEADICNSTGFCSDNTKHYSSDSSSSSWVEEENYPVDYEDLMNIGSADSLTKVGETRLCTACRAILYKLRTTLKSPMTQAIMIKLLLRACTTVHRRSIRKCKKMVTEYGPVAMTLISRFVNVVDLCSFTHFCQVLEPRSKVPAEAHTKFTEVDQGRWRKQ